MASAATAAAQTAADRAAVAALPERFAAAWAARDARALAALMAEDVDFVNVGARHLRGRGEVEADHARLFAGRFGQSRLTGTGTRVRFAAPDLAIVHWRWAMQGDRNPDGSARAPRTGLMTMVALKREEAWRIAAAHNTNTTVPEPPVGPGR